MNIKESIVNTLKEYDFIKAAFIFGSYGTEDFTENSDIDIAILVQDNIDYMKLLDIEERLESELNIPVDLNSLEELPENIQLQVMIRNENLYVSDEEYFDTYLDKVDYWYKTEFPFWSKMVSERMSI